MAGAESTATMAGGAEVEAANRNELLRKLPAELWSKIVDEHVQQNDLLALAMTCRLFREKQKDLGWKLETDLTSDRFLDLRMSGKMTSHTLGWFQWVCDTLEILPGYEWGIKRVKGAVYEGDLLNYAALQGSAVLLRWLVEEKGWKLNDGTGWYAGVSGSIEVLGYVVGMGYEFTLWACSGAARAGRLEALKFLRGLDPPCPWGEKTCTYAAERGHLEVLKWLRAQDPPCPWDDRTCAEAAREGHLDVLKWARSQNPPCPWNDSTCSQAAGGGRLESLEWARSQDPPCPWRRPKCRKKAWEGDHEHVVEWIDQQEDESSYFGRGAGIYGEDWMYSDDTIDY